MHGTEPKQNRNQNHNQSNLSEKETWRFFFHWHHYHSFTLFTYMCFKYVSGWCSVCRSEVCIHQILNSIYWHFMYATHWSFGETNERTKTQILRLSSLTSKWDHRQTSTEEGFKYIWWIEAVLRNCEKTDIIAQLFQIHSKYHFVKTKNVTQRQKKSWIKYIICFLTLSRLIFAPVKLLVYMCR